MVNLYAQQCMYNATMYNVMMQNMMPCVPMPCIPAYGYPMPYPSIMSNRPVNHAMSAGHYYEKGGRSRQSRKSRSKGDGNAYHMPHHRRHRVVSHHRYYEPSSESDSANEYLYTGEKGVQACRSVNRKMTADKSYHHNDTLRHSNPKSNKGQRRLQNDRSIADVTPLPAALNHSKSVEKKEVDIAAQVPLCRNSRNNVTDMHKNGQSNIRTGSGLPNTTTSFEKKVLTGTATISNQMPLNSLHSQNAVTAVIGCHQGEPTTTDEPDVVIAVNNTKPLGHQSKAFVTETSDSLLGVDSNQSTAEQLTALPAQYVISSNTNQMTHDATCDKSPFYDESLSGIADATRDSKPKDDSQLIMSAVHTDSDKSGVVETYVSTKLGRVISSPASLQLHSNTTVQALGSEQDGSTSGHQQDPAQVLDWRNIINHQKCLQSLHSLRKMWVEWETKYRPPPVSRNTSQGAGPQNLYASIS